MNELAVGTMVGEYRVERLIGEGSFGKVYAAIHPVIDKPAAIKVLDWHYSERPEWVSRFVAEARAVNRIKNRNIVDIFAFGQLPDGRQYFAMELLEGATLRAHLERVGRMPIGEALPFLRKVARAIDAAHRAGITHRDLKPDNLFLTWEDGVCFPKVLDFGIAKLAGDDHAHRTATGVPLGTPLYMSPEQCRGKAIDSRTDVYAFGVIIHEMLTGRRPFDGDNVTMVMVEQLTVPAPPMSAHAPDLPQLLDAPVLRMLAKEPEQRTPTLTAAIDELWQAAKAAGYTQLDERTEDAPQQLHGPRAPEAQQPMHPQAMQPTPMALVAPGPEQPQWQPPLPPGNWQPAPQRESSQGMLVAFLLIGGVGVLVVGIVIAAFFHRRPEDGAAAARSATAGAPVANAVARAVPSVGATQEIESRVVIDLDVASLGRTFHIKSTQELDLYLLVQATDENRVTRGRVSIERYQSTTVPGDGVEKNVTAGKVYLIDATSGYKATNATGVAMTADEEGELEAVIGDLFRADPVAALIASRPLALGEQLQLNEDQARYLLQPGRGTTGASQATLTLKGREVIGGASRATFGVSGSMVIHTGELDMTTELSGDYVVDDASGAPISFAVGGPVGMGGAKLQGAANSGRITSNRGYSLR